MSDLFISRETAQGDLLACAAFLAERIKSSDGRAEAMDAIIPLYLAKGDVDLAAELANATAEPFSRDKLLLMVAEKCAAVDDVDYGLQLAEALEDHGIQAQALERIALVEAGKGNLTAAFEIAGGMAHPDLVFAGIAAYQAANNDETASAATLEQIAFPSARVSSLQQVAAARIKGGQAESAIDPLDRAVDAAGDIEHAEEKIRDYCDIGNLYIELGRKDKAVSTYQLAKATAETLDNTHRDFFLVNCALGFLYAGEGDLADDTLDLVNDKTQIASALLGFARDYWKNEEKQDAIDALEEAYEILKSQREKETRDSRARNNLFASIAVQFAGFGKTERGLDIASENVDPNERMAALAQIAQILTVQKEDGLARDTINMIEEDANRLFALTAVSDAKHGLGETDASIAMLDEAVSLAETVGQFGARSKVLNGIASRYADRGLADKAREVSLTNLAIIRQIRDEPAQASALAALWEIYNRSGITIGEKEGEHLGVLVSKADF